MSASDPAAVPEIPGLAKLKVLAHGGFATVYRAIQLSVDREVAVKVEKGRLDGDSDKRRFLREARATARMSSHPHVVDLFDVGVTDDGHPYLIMELCEGTYADRMRTQPLSVAEARDVGAKVADALADAHRLGVVHRDVKPANILVSRFGEPVLADFGTAVLAESREVSFSLELTPAYAAPELFQFGRSVAASDVYSLCATLYALISGRPPRWPDGYHPTMASVVDMFAEPLADLPGAPAALNALLRRGMADDPAQRPVADELRDELVGYYRDPNPTMIMRGPTPRADLDQPTLVDPVILPAQQRAETEAKPAQG